MKIFDSHFSMQLNYIVGEKGLVVSRGHSVYVLCKARRNKIGMETDTDYIKMYTEKP